MCPTKTSKRCVLLKMSYVVQELTFDYRFKIEEGAAKLPCRCGAPNCRGTLN
jgi:SET domain-containing protein